jgi:site-specific DNA-methyltransferase (adenine-specific)
MSCPTAGSTKGEQSVMTPSEFMVSVRNVLGVIAVDLAADEKNKQASVWIERKENSLQMSWNTITKMSANGSWLWLNPPFEHIEPWVKKCYEESILGAKILCLLPASVGSNWYRDWVRGKCFEIYLNGRIKFVGHKDAYPKDLMLLVWGGWLGVGSSVWDWKNYVF